MRPRITDGAARVLLLSALAVGFAGAVHGPMAPSRAEAASRTRPGIALMARPDLIATQVRMSYPIKRVELRLDGAVVSPRVVSYSTTYHELIYQPRGLAPGAHTVRVTVWDAHGASRWHQAMFSVTLAQATARADDTARLFLDAFRLRDKAGMLRLMSPRLLERNRDEAVARMLGVQNTPRRIDVTGTRIDRARDRATVTATLRFAQDSVTCELGLIKTATGYRVDSIAKAAARRSSSPAIRIASATVTPGDSVLVEGDGWPAGTPVSISLGGVNTGAGGDYGSATADVQGHFTITVKLAALPNGAPLTPGSYVLLAHNADGSLKASLPITVTE